MRSRRGITLIALVVTIIILIILAGVSINIVLGENGIINMAKKAKEDMEIATQDEQKQLDYLEAIINGTKAIKYVKEEGYVEKVTFVEDTSGNKFVLPKGFKIAEDSGNNVTEGIVIEDDDIIDGIGNNRGNQYVWIPVGEDIKKSDGTTIDIILGRYDFADGTNDKGADGVSLEKGTPILIQNAKEYEKQTDEILIDSYFKELTKSRIGTVNEEDRLKDTNTTALNLKGFIESVKSNGGYYIARYEASYGVDGKANSKISNNFTNSGTAPTTRTEGMLWNHITQIDSATASRNLYATINSDLMNSYAWDTAIVYIQNFSKDTDYSYQDGNSINASLTNTGVNNDELCKINDMSSNTVEWTTEYSSYIENSMSKSCVGRGGYYYSSTNYSSYRNISNANNSYTGYTFRHILFI